MTELIPAMATVDGQPWPVRRAWPGDRHGLPLELSRTMATGDSGTRDFEIRGARWLGGRVSVFGPGQDPRLPRLAEIVAAGGTVVSHRPGKRAVVRTPGLRDDGLGTWVKVVRPGRARRIVDATATAAAFTGPFRTASVLAMDDSSVRFSHLPGESLHTGMPQQPDATWRQAWQEILAAWSEAVAGDRGRTQLDLTASVHSAEAEIEVLHRWQQRAATIDPAGAARREPLLARARRLLAILPEPARLAPLHRDLHDKQLIWDAAAGPALLDVDTAAMGDPALDLANLRVHARWREIQGGWTPGRTSIVLAEIDRAAEQVGIDRPRMRAYQASTVARLLCVYAFRPTWRHRLDALAELD